MADVDIDIKKLRQIAMQLSAKESVLDDARRTLALMRWKLPEDMTNKRNIDERLKDLLIQLERTQNMMQNIRNATNECVAQFMSAEEKNIKNINRLL